MDNGDVIGFITRFGRDEEVFINIDGIKRPLIGVSCEIRDGKSPILVFEPGPEVGVKKG